MNLKTALKTTLLILLTLLVALYSEAQICKGRVLEEATGKPAIYVNIFLDGSNIGTVSDSTGRFTFDTQGHFSLPLIVSSIGFETMKFNNNYIKDSLIIYLKKKDYELEEVHISAQNQKFRKKYLKVFEKEFLGDTKNGKQCEIINPNVLHPFFNKETKVLHVNASQPIRIINPNLGYKIIYLLKSFKQSKEGINYSGYSLFIDVEQEKKRQKRKIEANRESAFLYSRMHFIRCLYKGDLKYTCFKLADNLRNVIKTDDVVFKTTNVAKEICYDKVLMLYFEPDARQPYMGYSKEKGKWVWSSDVLDARETGKYSWFILNEECVQIESYGYYNPESITWYGDISAFRVGDLLPYNYNVKLKTE